MKTRRERVGSLRLAHACEHGACYLIRLAPEFRRGRKFIGVPSVKRMVSSVLADGGEGAARGASPLTRVRKREIVAVTRPKVAPSPCAPLGPAFPREGPARSDHVPKTPEVGAKFRP